MSEEAEFKITAPGDGVSYPAIYQPQSPRFEERPPRYGLTLTKWEDDLRLYEWNRIVHLTARYAPEVGCLCISKLVEELARLDARNLPRDHVFKEARKLTLQVCPFEYNSPRVGRGVGLRLIRVDVTLF